MILVLNLGLKSIRAIVFDRDGVKRCASSRTVGTMLKGSWIEQDPGEWWRLGMEVMKEVLWRLATKELRSGEWRKLAHHWGFSDAHIKAIEHQYTGIHICIHVHCLS